MKLPFDIDKSRIPEAVLQGAVRDHGDAAHVTRMFLDPFAGVYTDLQIGGIVWRYDLSGSLIDAYRWISGSFGSGHRKEVEKRSIRVQPVLLTYDPVDAATFFDLVKVTESGVYEGSRNHAGPCYKVISDDCVIGYVVQVRYSSEMAGSNPRIQWLAATTDGRAWFGYGRTREEASRYLLSDEARKPTKDRLAA